MTLPLLAVPEAAPRESRSLALVDGDLARAAALARLLDDGATAIARMDDADLERLVQVAPDLVIGSIDALVDDDFLLIQALARAESAAPIPVVVIVDEEEREPRVRALRAGAADCLVWPPDPNELCARIETQVRQARRMQALWFSSYRDPLTGLLNRRGLLHLLRREIERAARREESLALLFIDLDGFKQVNDRHGHDVGDLLLKCVAELLAGEVRSGDVVARLGGDEFVVVLPRRDARGAQLLAARLEARLARALPHSQLGASVGVAALTGAKDAAAEELLRRADRAMYARKQIRCGRVAQGKR